MTRSARLAGTTVTVIVLTSVVSGPLVGAIDFTPTESAQLPPPGSGSASVRVASVPNDSIVLQRGAFGSGTYHFEAPPAILVAGTVRGNPYIEYLIRVPGIEYADITQYSLQKVRGSRLRLEFRPVEISPTRVTRKRYSGTLEIRLQSNDSRILYESSVTIHVRR